MYIKINSCNNPKINKQTNKQNKNISQSAGILNMQFNFFKKSTDCFSGFYDNIETAGYLVITTFRRLIDGSVPFGYDVAIAKISSKQGKYNVNN